MLPLPLTAAALPYAAPPQDAAAADRYESAGEVHAREALAQAGAGEARLRTAVGQVSDVLLRVADDEDALMLVMGTSDSRLLLAHVLEDDAAGEDPALAEAESRVEAFDPALKVLGPTEALIETRVGFGAAAERLVALARASGASMVVTGSHDHGRVHAALHASTSRTLIRDAGVPTLVCPVRP